MRVLVVGGEGQLGTEVLHCLASMKAEIGPIPEAYLGAEVDSTNRDTLNIADVCSIRAWFLGHSRYDLIINCAAYTDVDGCENNEASALHVNAIGAEHLAHEANSSGANFVHISTDYVFSGIESRSRIETDEVGPVSAYGRSKWAGECLVAAACKRCFIVRTAWLYGYSGDNFVKTMRRLGVSQKQVSVVVDQIGSPTNANDLAYEILKVALTKEYGIYHCVNNGVCSWADFADAIMVGSGIPCEVLPVSTKEYKTANPGGANRPLYSSLRNKRLEDTVGDEMRSWRVALSSYLKNVVNTEG